MAQSKAAVVDRTFLDNLYLTLQLAVLSYGGGGGDLNWRLEVARFAAPLMATATLFQAASWCFVSSSSDHPGPGRRPHGPAVLAAGRLDRHCSKTAAPSSRSAWQRCGRSWSPSCWRTNPRPWPPHARREDLARALYEDHNRWRARRGSDGWRYGKVRDAREKVTPQLVAWDELNPEWREYNLARIRAMPTILARTGFEVGRR